LKLDEMTFSWLWGKTLAAAALLLVTKKMQALLGGAEED